MYLDQRIQSVLNQTYQDFEVIILDEEGCSIENAFSRLYDSQTYAKLSDPNTLLYTQSAGYVYSLLEDEQNHKQ